ncbi:MAG: OB-fold domain-containing protein [Myxococcota bacterium]|nr:OB-fold domain-containing protein [Myxococcota bacterium]
MSAPAKFIPDPDGRNADFYRHLAGGTLHLQRCEGCSQVFHPPRFRCARCGSDALAFDPSPGKGRIFSWTVTHRPVDPGWAAEALPYATVVIEMEEGIRLVGGWRGTLEEIRLDLPVCAEVEPANESFGLIYFAPVEQGD